MRRSALPLALAVLALGWFLLGDSETRRVRRVFARVEAALLKEEASEHALVSLSRGRDLAALVADACRLDVPDRGFARTFEPRDVPGQVATLRQRSRRMRAVFEDLSVTFPRPGTAEVAGDFFYEGESDSLGLLGRDARALEATLEKDAGSGAWKFVRVKLAEIVRR